MKRTRTHIVTLAATKGGVGKSTLTAALAVRASEESRKVAILDGDTGQNSLSRWWQLRGSPKSPNLVKVDCTPEGVGLVAAQGYEWLFIDTPPRGVDEIGQAVSVADFVLIPTRASALDVEAVDQVVEMCNLHHSTFAFVLNAAQPTWVITREARAFLSDYGKVLDPMVAYRKAHIAAATLGKTGAEYDKDGKCRDEIEALWRAVKAMATEGVK